MNLRGAFICFILCDTILSPKVFSRFKNLVLIEQCWDCYQLTGLISSFFRSLAKISQPLSHFGIFIANKEEGVFQLFLRILPNKKIWAIKRLDVLEKGTLMLMPIVLCFPDVFLHFNFIFYILLAMFSKSIIVLLESSLCFETAVKQFETS